MAGFVEQRIIEIGPETGQTSAELRFVRAVGGRVVQLTALLDIITAQGENQSPLLSAGLADQAGNLSREIQSRAPLWKKAWRAATRLASVARRIARHFANAVTVALIIPLGDGAMLTITVQPGPPNKRPAADDEDDGTQ